MRLVHRVGAALAAAILLGTGVTGPATSDIRALTDEERAAAREKATRARTASVQPQDSTLNSRRWHEVEPTERAL